MLIKINGKWCLSRLSAYKRYIKVIKPLNDFLHYCDDEEQENPREYIKVLKGGKTQCLVG